VPGFDLKREICLKYASVGRRSEITDAQHLSHSTVIDMNRLLTLTIVLMLPVLARSAEPAAAAVPEAAGCWSGYWISCDTGHKGPLSAKICKISDTCCEAHFRGRFALVIPFRYTATMQVVSAEGDKLILSSSRRLPLMGTFTMTATVTATEFRAAYTSRNDHGEFVMQRQ